MFAEAGLLACSGYCTFPPRSGVVYEQQLGEELTAVGTATDLHRIPIFNLHATRECHTNHLSITNLLTKSCLSKYIPESKIILEGDEL